MESALEEVRKTGQTFIVTTGKDGAAVIRGEKITRITPVFVPHGDIRDSIRAGDQFAAGFIAGIAAGKSLLDACRQGTLKASEILAVEGARPQVQDTGTPAPIRSSGK